jgi:hypothetical protein
MLGAWLLCSAFLSAGMLERAEAQEKRRVVVQSFRGPSSGAVRNHVVSALRDQADVELVPSAAFEGASGGALRDAAAEAGVSAVVQGKVTKRGKLLAVSISVRDADTGEVVQEESWTKKKPQLDDVGRDFWARLGPAVMRTHAPEKKPEAPVAPVKEKAPVAAPPPVAHKEELEPEPEPRSSVSSAASDEAVHPALIVSPGLRLLWRSLEYEGDTMLNGYSSFQGESGTGPGFTLTLNVQWFPGAHVRRGWPSDIGLELDGDYSFLKSKLGDEELKTKAYEWSSSLLYRLPLDSFEPRFRLGYVRQKFDVQAPPEVNLPAVTYGSIRIGVGTLIHIVRAFSLDVGAGYLIVLSTGEFGKKRYAEDLSAYGWEISGGATYRIRDAYGIRMGAEFRRYGLDTGKSENDRVLLPKEGRDDYLRLTLAFVYALEGK